MCGVVPWLCRHVGSQIRLAGCVSTGKYVATSAMYSSMDTINQPDLTAYTLHHTWKNTTKSSAPEDGHKVTRNMLSNL